MGAVKAKIKLHLRRIEGHCTQKRRFAHADSATQTSDGSSLTRFCCCKACTAHARAFQTLPARKPRRVSAYRLLAERGSQKRDRPQSRLAHVRARQAGAQ
jgi:hypothetical protein